MAKKKQAKPNRERVEQALRALEENNYGDPIAAWLAGKGQLDASDVPTASAAVAAARRLGRGELLVALRDATRVKAVRKQAATAIHRLRTEGHEIDDGGEQRTWAIGEQKIEYPPPTALLGFPLPDGYFPYAVMTYGAEGGVICAGLAGCGQGFRDEEHAHMGRSKARQTWDDLRRKSGWQEVPFVEALHFLEKAFTATGEHHPPGWGHVLDNVPPQTRDSARMLDPLKGQETKLEEDGLYQVDEVIEGEASVRLMVEEGALVEGVQKVVEATASELELSDETRRERIEAIVDETADKGLSEHQRETWALALEVTAYLAARMELEAMRRVARNTALAIRAERKGSQVPYVRALVQRVLQPTGQ